jgi:uncharacterized protein YchJ
VLITQILIRLTRHPTLTRLKKTHLIGPNRAGRFTFPKIPQPLLPAALEVYFIIRPYTTITNGDDSDFKHEDGWELIKQDMGFFYSSGNWDGSPKNFGDPLNQQQAASPVAYIVLYNKYTSVLRVITYAPNANITFNNIIYTTLKFQTSIGGNNPNYSTFKFSALFNHYNSYAQALDKSTTVTRISTPAICPTSIGSWFYSDFQLAYDPCVCFFDGGFSVEFYNKTTATIALNGKYAGVNNIPVANYTNGSGTMKGNVNSDNFISSIFDGGTNSGSPESVLQNYFSTQNIQNQANQTGNIDIKNVLSGLATGLDIAAGLATGNIGSSSIKIKDALSGGSKAVKFLSTQLKDPTSPTESPVTIMSGYLEATGTITYNDNNFPGYRYTLGVPGAQNANMLTEYSSSSGAANGLKPTYPMYNEPTGLFALLKTPEVELFQNIPQNEPCYAACYAHFIKYKIHAQNDLVYALNPIINPAKSNIYIQYEFDGMPYTDENISSYFDTQTLIGATDFLYNDYGDYFEPATNTNLSHSFVKNITPTYPIGCNQNIYASETYSAYAVNFPAATKYYWYKRILRPRKIILSVLLDLESYPDSYGKTHRTSQIIKYECKVNNSPTDFTTSGPGQAALNSFTAATTNLQLVNNNYSIPASKYSFGDISIKGIQSNNNSNNGLVEIVAEKDIVLSNESKITGVGETHLYSNSLPKYFEACSTQNAPPFAGSISDYCKNQNSYAGNTGYQANSASSRLVQINDKNNENSITNSRLIPFKSRFQETFVLVYIPTLPQG